MAFCGKCGNELKDGEKFCSSCGAPVDQASSSTTAANAAFENAKKQAETIFVTKDTANEYDKSEIEANKIICMLAYIPILFFLPLVLCPKNSKYARFHANQGLLLLILSVVINIVGILLLFIPVLGLVLMPLLELVILGAIAYGIVFTVLGQVRELPIIGGIRII